MRLKTGSRDLAVGHQAQGARQDRAVGDQARGEVAPGGRALDRINRRDRIIPGQALSTKRFQRFFKTNSNRFQSFPMLSNRFQPFFKKIMKCTARDRINRRDRIGGGGGRTPLAYGHQAPGEDGELRMEDGWRSAVRGLCQTGKTGSTGHRGARMEDGEPGRLPIGDTADCQSALLSTDDGLRRYSMIFDDIR